MKQTFSTQLTYAAPAAATLVSLADSQFARLVAIRVIAENDNASTAVQVQAVVSRSSSPLTSGSMATEKALARGDALIAILDMSAGKTAVLGSLNPASNVLDTSQLFDSSSPAYLGLKVVGLESGKVANLQVELTFDEVSKSVANTGVYLAQVVTFQQTGT